MLKTTVMASFNATLRKMTVKYFSYQNLSAKNDRNVTAKKKNR